MTTKLDVTKDRDKYIGGSDMPAIMGISKFRSRWDLLQEKALGKRSNFEGNEYTEYGKRMEPVIREYINKKYGHFVDDEVRIDGDLRYHADGYEESNDMWEGESRLLEIKTTSDWYEYSEDADCDDAFAAEREFLYAHYKSYLVQLLLGMRLFKSRIGCLAIYHRPEDMSEELDPERLQEFIIRADEWGGLYEEMDRALDQFRIDRDKLEENPFLTEEDLQPTEIVKLADKALAIEQELVRLKQAEQEAKEVKAALKTAMEEHNVKKWTTNNGVQITLVPDGKDKTVKEFDKDKFVAENKDLADTYMIEKVKKGRKGYVRITL